MIAVASWAGAVCSDRGNVPPSDIKHVYDFFSCPAGGECVVSSREPRPGLELSLGMEVNEGKKGRSIELIIEE